MNELKTLLHEINLPLVLFGLFVLLAAIKIIWETISYFYNKLGLETKYSRAHDHNTKKITEHDQSIDNINKILEELRIANMASLADRINQKYKYYLRIEGIPEDEFDEFIQLHDAYKGVGGNHTIDAKFKKAMNFHVYTLEDMIEKRLY